MSVNKETIKEFVKNIDSKNLQEAQKNLKEIVTEKLKEKEDKINKELK
jgi:uncharacterized protein YktA (UPF0223 family)